MRTKDRRTTAAARWTCTRDRAMLTSPISRNTASRRAVVVGGVVQGRPSVRHFYSIPAPRKNFLIDLPSRTSRRRFNSREIPLSCPQRLDSCLCLVCRSRTPFPPTPTHPTLSTNPAFLSLISSITREQVDSFVPVRCPDADASARMKKVIERFRDAKDSIGGTVTCVIRNCPIGLGEPVFDKLEAMLAHAMLSIPATKGFEIETGFGGCEVPGSVHNDSFTLAPSVPPAPNSSSST
jgi:hypothetical protein